MLGFIIGSIVGGFLGIVMMSAIIMGKQEDEAMASYIQKKQMDKGTNTKPKIRFVDAKKQKLFEVTDGGTIEQLYQDGERQISVCHYLDEEHAEIDGMFWEMKEFAKAMEKRGILFFPTLKKEDMERG